MRRTLAMLLLLALAAGLVVGGLATVFDSRGASGVPERTRERMPGSRLAALLAAEHEATRHPGTSSSRTPYPDQIRALPPAEFHALGEVLFGLEPDITKTAFGVRLYIPWRQLDDVAIQSLVDPVEAAIATELSAPPRTPSAAFYLASEILFHTLLRHPLTADRTLPLCESLLASPPPGRERIVESDAHCWAWTPEERAERLDIFRRWADAESPRARLVGVTVIGDLVLASAKAELAPKSVTEADWERLRTATSDGALPVRDEATRCLRLANAAGERAADRDGLGATGLESAPEPK